MLSSLSIKSNEGHNFFGRIMDLAYDFNPISVNYSRNHQFKDKVTKDMVKTKYAIIGIRCNN